MEDLVGSFSLELEEVDDFETISSRKSNFGGELNRLKPISEYFIILSFTISSLFIASFTYEEF